MSVKNVAIIITILIFGLATIVLTVNYISEQSILKEKQNIQFTGNKTESEENIPISSAIIVESTNKTTLDIKEDLIKPEESASMGLEEVKDKKSELPVQKIETHSIPVPERISNKTGPIAGGFSDISTRPEKQPMDSNYHKLSQQVVEDKNNIGPVAPSSNETGLPSLSSSTIINTTGPIPPPGEEIKQLPIGDPITNKTGPVANNDSL